jgi:isopenicillin N synthase-like dioxygenase
LAYSTEPLRLSDFTRGDSAARSRFVEAVGNSFLERAHVVVVTDLPAEEVRAYYRAAADLLRGLPEETLRRYEFVKQGIERGYLDRPSGAPKVVTISLSGGPKYLAAAGLSFVFERHNGASTVTISGTEGEARVALPVTIYGENNPDGEVRAEHERRSLRFVCVDDGIYQVFSPDDKHGWITGREHNVYPAGMNGVATLSGTVYRAQEALCLNIVEALGEFLGDRRGVIRKLVVDGSGRCTAEHSLRAYRYPAMRRHDGWFSADPVLIRVGEHRDISLLTALAKTSLPGLQVQARDGCWVNVRAPENGVVVLAGEILAAMTKGLKSEAGASLEIPSASHRVVGDPETMSQDRYTAPFFFNPDLRQKIPNLAYGGPITVGKIELDPGMRLLHAHMRASTRFAQLTFEEFAAEYARLGDRLAEAVAKDPEIQAMLN